MDKWLAEWPMWRGKWGERGYALMPWQNDRQAGNGDGKRKRMHEVD